MEKTPDSQQKWDMPVEFENELPSNTKAKEYFDSLAPSYKRHYIGWIASGKRKETRIKRSKEAVRLLENNKKLGMK